MLNYLVATIKPWNIEAFHRNKHSLPGKWHLITARDELSKEYLDQLKPRYIFFPHWSWVVPSEIVQEYECVCFHMTDLPYGRGGSPLQNLIQRGHEDTKLSALRMTEELDAGPIYTKLNLSLAGSAQQIFQRASELVYIAARAIVETEPCPTEQVGAPTLFNRRAASESVLPEKATRKQLYDHIRMLDAETYPRAFLEKDNMRFEFSDAEICDNKLICNVEISFHGDN